MKPRRGMVHGRLDRDDHAGLERLVGVIAGIGDRRAVVSRGASWLIRPMPCATKST